MSVIKIYGADWCVDCRRIKSWLISNDIEFEEIIITENNEAIAFLEQINNGKRIIPTVLVKGKAYPNPGINQLMKIIAE